MLTKSKDGDNSQQVGTIFEYGGINYRGPRASRLVITNDGYVVYINHPDAFNLYSTNFPTGTLDQYMKDHPENVLVRNNLELVENIIKFAFQDIGSTSKFQIKRTLKDIPNEINSKGCGSSIELISFLGDKYTIKGYLLKSTLNMLLTGTSFPKLKNWPLEKIQKMSPNIPGYILIADTLLNVYRAIVHTNITQDQIPEKLTPEKLKAVIGSKLFMGYDTLEKTSIQEFLKSDDRRETYFNFIPWFTEKYYMDAGIIKAFLYFNDSYDK